MNQPIHLVALSTLLLGTALVACAASQQDNQAPSAPATQLAASAEPLTAAAPQQPRVRHFFVQPRQRAQLGQLVPQVGPVLRLRQAGGPRLGVMVAETADGLRVDSIDDGSLAQSAGVKAEDVLLRIGDEHVRHVIDIQRALAAYKPGDTVKVAVIRAGEGIVELQGTLPEPKEPPAPPPAAPGADGFKGGFLGVQMGKAGDDEDVAGSGGEGVKVAGVVPESAAWFAGLQEGDRLLALDGKTLGSSEDLVGAVSGKEPGSLVELRYSRDGSEQTARVRLGHRQAPGAFGMFGGAPLLIDPQGQHGQMLPDMQDMQDMQAMPGLRLRFGDRDVRPGQDDDGVFRFMQDPHQFFGGALKGFDTGHLGPGSQSVQIEMHDGKGTMTVTRDGATETYTLDEKGNWVPDDGTSPDDTQTTPRVRNG